jgi:hypothetical protein
MLIYSSRTFGKFVRGWSHQYRVVILAALINIISRGVIRMTWWLSVRSGDEEVRSTIPTLNNN